MHNENEFYQLAKRLLAEVAALRQSIEHSNCYQRERDQKADEARSNVPPEPPPIRVNAEVHEPEDVARQNNAHHNENFRLQVWLTIGTWFAFIAAAVYAGIAREQKVVMDNTLTQVQRQADDNHRYLVGTQGAVVSIGMAYDPTGGNAANNGVYEVTINNVGRMTATVIRFHADAQQVRMQDGQLIGEPSAFEPKLGLLTFNNPEPKRFTVPWHYQASQEWPGTISYLLRAEVTYDNGFGELQTTTMCRRWLPTYNGTTSAGAVGGGGLVDCQGVATEIRNGLQRLREIKQYQNQAKKNE